MTPTAFSPCQHAQRTQREGARLGAPGLAGVMDDHLSLRQHRGPMDQNISKYYF